MQWKVSPLEGLFPFQRMFVGVLGFFTVARWRFLCLDISAEEEGGLGAIAPSGIRWWVRDGPDAAVMA